MSEKLPALVGRQCVMVDEKHPDRLAFRFVPRIIDENHMIEAAIATVPLSLARGHLVTFKSGGKQNWMIGVDGFRAMNQLGAVSIIYPPEIVVPGKGLQPNPYIETDDEGSFSFGFAWAIGVARNPFGETMLISRPTPLSLKSYLEEDLASKAEYNPNAVAFGPKDMSPQDAVRLAIEANNEDLREQIASKEAKNQKADWLKEKIRDPDAVASAVEARFRLRAWRYLPILGDDMGIHYDATHPVVQRVLRTLIQGRKFGPRKLLAIAERNVLRTAFGQYKLAETDIRDIQTDRRGNIIDASASVLVHYHRSHFDREKIEAIVKAYSQGMQSELQFAGKSVMIDHQTEKVTAQDMGVTGDGDSPETVIEGEVTEPASDAAAGKIIVDIKAGEEMVDARIVGKLRKAAGIMADADLAKVSVDALKAYRADLNRAIDGATASADAAPATSDHEEPF